MFSAQVVYTIVGGKVQYSGAAAAPTSADRR